MKMECESGTNKVSDSGYSNSCSNSQSQRSGSSKSRNSESNSSRSSGYCGHLLSSLDAAPQPISKRTKEKEHKKKKNSTICATILNQESCLDSIENPTKVLTTITECGELNASAEQLLSGNAPTGAAISTARLAPIQETDVSTGEFAPLSPAAAHVAVVLSPTLRGEQEQMKTKGSGNATFAEVAAEISANSDAAKDCNIPQVDFADNPAAGKQLCQPEDGFCCVISMYDGVVLYTTPGLTTVLGFPKDMWLGRSFIEFVHKKDREIFASQITNGMNVPFADNKAKQKDIRNSLFVNLRRYRGLKNSGYGVVEKAVSYQPFHLSITFRQVNDQTEAKYADESRGMFLIVVAVPVHTIYTVPDESCNLSKFTTRHTASCIISHVDQDVVTNFGFFPQDMIGRCIFDFYHPLDMPLLKEIYQKVMEKCKDPGTLYKSKPYRFLVQNGEYAIVETEWTSFVNPWTKKLEIVINHHKIIQGPCNPNVFDQPNENGLKNVSDEVLKNGRIIREEIQLLLNQLVHLESAKQQIFQRCKDLALFMETLMGRVSKSPLKIDLSHENNTSISVSNEFKLHSNGNSTLDKERDSVMLGEISPHHDYYDSKSSSETPPSYNQLNYNENIQRFFKSKPMTTVSNERNEPLQRFSDTDQEVKSSSLMQDSNNQKCLSPINGSGASGSGSGNLSSECIPQMENGTSTNVSNDSYKPPHLTEALLLKHNEDMEKIMAKRHRNLRTLSKIERDEKKAQTKNYQPLATAAPENHIQPHQIGIHGVKRSGSHSWEEDNHKVSKHQHQNQNEPPKTSQPMMQDNPMSYTPLLQCSNMQANNANVPINVNKNIYQPGVDNVNLWPPFSVTVTPFHTTQPCTTGIMSNPAPGYTTGMFTAVCYIPAPAGQTPREYPGPPVQGQYPVQYMPSMMYPTIFGASPMMYPPMTMLQPMAVPMQQPHPHPPPIPTVTVDTTVKETEQKPSQPIAGPNANAASKRMCQRPASQATSVKAEPGSVFGSIASASVANRANSECSRKDLALQSVCSPDSLLVSLQDGDIVAENNFTGRAKVPENLASRQVNTDCTIEADEESSYSSFYSSFLKTDPGSGSNEDNNNDSDLKQSKDDRQEVKWRKPKSNPIRKPDPTWLDDVTVTPELIYRYQMTFKNMEHILQSDLNLLKEIKQPDMVNNQLEQLYLEMELEGLSTKLTLDDGITLSSSSEEENSSTFKPKKKKRSYSQLVMIYEEDAPLPPPNTSSRTELEMNL